MGSLLFDPNKLAEEICMRHEMHVGCWPGEVRESVRRQAFSDTIGKLPELIENKLISPVDGLYVMQIFMRYRSGNDRLSLVHGRSGVERVATSQEWGLIQLLFSGAMNKHVSH